MPIFANLSGGRDSSAMVVKWLESGEKLDYVLFCDTGFEFAEMYEYIDKLDNYLQKRFNIGITRLDSRAVIERWGPHCQKQIVAFWGSEFETVESYVCRYCDKTYFAAWKLRVEIWKGN